MTQATHVTQNPEYKGRGTHEIADAATSGNRGPIRTLRVGDRITVYGDLEVIAVEGRRVQVRVVKASAPPPEPVMFPAQA